MSYAPLIESAALANGLDPDLVKRQVQAESAGNPNAYNKGSGAAGLIQIMSATARDPGYGVKPISDADRFDPVKNVEFGTSYLGALRKKYGDDKAALVAYNWGPGNADTWLKNGARDEDLPAETRGYVAKIMAGPSAAPAAAPMQQAAPTFKNAISKFKIVSTPAAPAAAPAEALPKFKEDASASAVVVPVTMQAPITQDEANYVAGLGGTGTRMGAYTIAKQRGLDDKQAVAYADSVLAGQDRAQQARAAEQAASDQPGDAELRNAKGRLASAVEAATLGTADDVAGLISPALGQSIRDARADYSHDNPVSAAIVSLVGGALPAAGLNAGLTRLGAAGVPVASRAARALTTFETLPGLGPKLRNAMRIGGQGAILGAADATGNGGDPLTGAAVGGIAGMVLPAASEAVYKGARALLASRASGAIRALSARLGESPTSLARRWSHFEAVTGRPMSIAEAADPDLAQELRALGRVKKGADKVLSAADAKATRDRPAQLAAGITGENAVTPLRRGIGAGGPVPNVGDEVVAQRQAMDDAMRPIERQTVPVSADEYADFMADPEIQRLAARDPQLRAAMRQADKEFTPPDANQAGDGSDVADGGFGAPDPAEVSHAFTVRDLEGLRQLLRSEQAGALKNGLGNIAAQHSQRAGRLEELISNEVPEYGAALEQYGTTARRITGLKEGGAGRTVRDAETFDLRRDLETPEARRGVVEGLRGRLVDEASTSEDSAVATAAKLSENAGTAETLRATMGRPEAKRLQRLGAVEMRAGKGLAQAARGEAPTERQDLMNIAAQTVEGLALIPTQATYWFKVRTAARWLKNVSMSADKAERIARLATLPGRAAQVIDALKAEGLTERKIREFFNQYGAASGAAVNEQAARR